MKLQPRDFCLNLLRAETEEEVVFILQECGLWDDRTIWRPYGDTANNRGIVGNQQSSPVASLVEKLVNSIDAILTAECIKLGIDPKGTEAPTTMQEAVKRFLGIRDGRVQNLDASVRTQYAERIRLVACGTKKNPAFLIIDNGEGQSPDDFPETFLSLLKQNKTAVPFVQGTFNMGGTGVLQFSGRHSFQLIISKRQPDLPARTPILGNRWGFTIIRRLDPGPTQPHTMYVYLAPEGNVLSFESDEIPVLPGSRYPQLYEDFLTAGTCIKLWDYKIPGRLKGPITLDLRYELERHLMEPGIPIRLQERRAGYKAHSYDTTMAGLCSVLADRRDLIEPGFDTGGPMEVPDLGTVQVRLVVVKERIDRSPTGTDQRFVGGIFYTVNGQLHSSRESDYIERRTRMDYVAKDMLVIVDCTALDKRVREDLFLASRDRMRQIPERIILEDSIIEYLKDHAGLKELNARRRQSSLATEVQEDSSEIFKALIKSDPTLANLFGKGQKIKTPIGPIPEPEPFIGKHFPTFFRIANEPKGGVTKKCPVNRTCRIDFETDANNDYFSRTTDPGRLEIRGAPNRVGSVHLWNGRATLRFAPPRTCSPSDQLRVTVYVSDISRVSPFESSFLMQVEQEAPPAKPGTKPPPSGASENEFNPPIPVHQDKWAIHDFNETSALKLKHGDEESIDIYINMDNIHLRNEMFRRRTLDPDLLKSWFKWGLYFLALGMLRQSQRAISEKDDIADNGESTDDVETIFNSIAQASKGLAITIIPIIFQLGKEKEVGKM
ncbi:MAG TPA: hypothetical protein PLO63_16915 [Syntrophales bacterium]|nr:hypothetical protein [Syntrophales bacterium]